MPSEPPADRHEYDIQVDIVGASGVQEFRVEAVSEKEALAEFKKNGGQFIAEDVHVEINMDTAKVV